MITQHQPAKVKYYGFDYPPVGILDLLKEYQFDNTVYIIDPIGVEQLPYNEITSDDRIIITTHESSSHHWFDKLLSRLKQCGVPDRNILLRSACLRDPDSPIPRVNTIADEAFDMLAKHPTMSSIAPTHHYVCLNRLPRWQRYQLVVEFIKRDLLKYGAVSYTSRVPSNEYSKYFPLVVDEKQVSYDQGHVHYHPKIQGALFNVATESSYEPEYTNTKHQEHGYPGMTEKTFKIWAMAQIPIWLAPYKSVDCYRKLGFDVFDDIVDHSYDLIVSPQDRITKVAVEVERLCQISNTRLTELKEKMSVRFQSNFDRLKYLAGNYQAEKSQWDHWLTQTQS